MGGERPQVFGDDALELVGGGSDGSHRREQRVLRALRSSASGLLISVSTDGSGSTPARLERPGLPRLRHLPSLQSDGSVAR